MTDLVGVLLIGCGLVLLALNVYEEYRIRKIRKELMDEIERIRNG